MGPNRARGIGSTRRSLVQTPPLSPESGSGGAGVLTARGDTKGINLSPALSEIGDATTGRITLGMVNTTILAMLLFYYWTRTAQGGG